MKRSIILVVGACASLLAYNAYSLTCGAQPSCDTLGYNYSGDPSNCLGNVLRCPFDQTKFTCTKKADIFAMFRLDWEAARDVPGYQDWHAPKSGIVIGQGGDITNRGSFFVINGKRVGSLTGDLKQRSFFTVSVSYDDVVYIEANDVKAYFVPYSGN